MQYCQQHKALQIFAYVFMLNHLHFIVQLPDVAGFLRDFKKHCGYELMKNLQETEPRVANVFSNEEGRYELWEKTNIPKIIETEEYYVQKKQYSQESICPFASALEILICFC